MGQLSRLGTLAVLLLAVGCGGSDTNDPGNSGPSSSSPSPSSQETPSTVDQKVQQKALVKPVTGTVDGAAFAGQLRVTEFVARDNKIFAVATITDVTGSISSAAITAIQGETYQLPVELSQDQTSLSGNGASSAALVTCDVLFLQLGPLDLDLLGLVVHLDQVVLNIDAQSAPGNLLGNLLCAITALLDPVSFLQNILQIVTLLNQIIGLIGSL
ncbi:MAG TPA: hypothetical protein VJV79_21920 [Polyangiaceae bacterium]|nr:hypothetical protein [Polyangiaceae bacterium]